MFGSIWCQIRHGCEIMVGEYLAGCLALYGTPMMRDPAQGTTQVAGGVGEMLPASGDFIGILSQNVVMNANGTIVMPSAPDDQVGGAGVIPGIMAGGPVLAGALGTIPLPSYFEQMVMGIGNLTARIKTAVTLRRWDSTALIEVEGEPSKAVADYTGYSQLLVTSGTGALTTTTALQTELSVLNGRWRVAQSGDFVRGKLESQLPPLNNASNVRILISGLPGYVKA